MPNRDFSDVSPAAKGKVASKASGGSEDRGTLTVKDAFSGSGLPGKVQPRDRSAGVKRATIYPVTQGL